MPCSGKHWSRRGTTRSFRSNRSSSLRKTARKNRTARTPQPSAGLQPTASTTRGSTPFISATTFSPTLCEAVHAVNGHFIFVCKPSSHPLIAEYIAGVDLAAHQKLAPTRAGSSSPLGHHSQPKPQYVKMRIAAEAAPQLNEGQVWVTGGRQRNRPITNDWQDRSETGRNQRSPCSMQRSFRQVRPAGSFTLGAGGFWTGTR